MTYRFRISQRLLAFVALAAALTTMAVSGSAVAQSPNVSVLTAIRAAHHPGFDRVVFEFTGATPSRQNVRYVARLLADPSGRQLSIAGRAILQVSLSLAVAHNRAGQPTVPARMAIALPNVMTVVRSGEFESVLSFGIGLAQRTSFHVATLTHPGRVIIDIGTPSRTVLRSVYFFDHERFAANRQPFVSRVTRPVAPGTPATALLDRLFAGPTASESSHGLQLLTSRATGFTGLSIVSGIARLRLTGSCSSGGSTVTIAQEIFATLKQLSVVRFVKIYDPSGHTEHPTGASDSIPFCLEP